MKTAAEGFVKELHSSQWRPGLTTVELILSFNMSESQAQEFFYKLATARGDIVKVLISDGHNIKE